MNINARISITLLVCITIATFAIVTISKSATPDSLNILSSVKTSFSDSKQYVLTDIDIVNNGCNYITSSLTPKKDQSKVTTIKSFAPELENHLTFLKSKKIITNKIMSDEILDIDNDTPIVTSKSLSTRFDVMYESLAQVSIPTQESIDNLKSNLKKETQVGGEIALGGLKWYIDNQNNSLQYLINYFNTQREQVSNNSIKSEYAKAEVKAILVDIDKQFKEVMDKIIERTQYSIKEISSGYGQVISTSVTPTDCVFLLNDYEDVTTTISVPLIRQFVCDTMFDKEYTTINYNNGTCYLYK
jgi:hypothetical protein